MGRKRKHTNEEWYNGVQRYGNAFTMRRENPSLYVYGHNHGLLKNTSWPNPKLHSAYTKEEFDEGVRRYGNPMNMRKHNQALLSCGYEHGWDKTANWSKKTRNGYTEEQLKKEVFDASRKFHSRGEFATKDKRNYSIAYTRHWLDEMDWLKSQENPYRDKNNYIYVYVFEQQKAFYVGETFHGSNRHWYHKKRGAVFEFAKENNIEIPEPIILEDNLDRLNEVRRQEHYWKLHYISLGYKTLNRGKTGEFSGSLGATQKWTRNKCREVALLCSHSGEMLKKFPGAYSAAWKNGWLKDYTWFIATNKPRPVLQYTKDGRLVGRWDSLGLAAKSLKYTSAKTGIHRCCIGRNKSAYGYVWKYADEAIPV